MLITNLLNSPRKLMATAFVAAALTASAGVDFTVAQGMPLSEAMESLSRKAHVRFFCDDQLGTIRVKGLSLKNAELHAILDKLLEGTEISYKIENDIVFLKRNKKAEPKATAPAAKKRAVTGRLLDENGEPLIGASVRVKGSNVGVLTDADGNYTIDADSDHPVLQYSCVGYKPAEAKVNADKETVTSLEPNAETLGEVVVTALGMKRDKKMLGYAIQEIKSDALNVTGDPSVVGALDGKVAGVQMNTASTGLGGSTKITIRGNSSLTDNNQPLWIVDGVPFTDNQSSEASAYGGYDRGGTSFDINPEDIESISVLKGPNAAALYGSRAGNGVILVTTKRGARKQGFGVSYSGSYTWSKAAETVKMQNKYGQGSQGNYVYNCDADGMPVSMTGELAFGPAYDSSLQPTYTGESIPYIYYGDKLLDYFKPGFAQFHTAALSHSSESSQYRLSVGFNDNNGMFRGETLDKLNIDLSAGATVNRWLSTEGKVTVSNTKAENRPLSGLNGEVAQLLLIPGNIRLSDLQSYQTDDRLHTNWFGPNQHYSNPYYVRNRFKNSDERWRAFGLYGATLSFTDWLKLNGKYTFDYYRTRVQETNLGLGDQAISTPDAPWQSKLTDDQITRNEINHFEQNIAVTMMGDKSIGEHYRLGFNLGANSMYQKYQLLGVTAQNLLDKDNWIFNTAERLLSAKETGYNRAMYSVFGSFQAAYKEFLSLDLTARNDWSSTLPSANNSFFYPSANLSYVISDFMRQIGSPLPQQITFAKLRLSAAQVGKDPDPYNLYNVYDYYFENGVRKLRPRDIKKNPNLKPEIKTSYEAGLDMKFFDNRLGFDFTWYDSRTKNQAMLVDASAPWTQQWVNAGCIRNTGVELMLYGTPVQTRALTFNITANLAHNVSTVESLADGVSRIYLSGDPNMPVKVGAVTGGKLGDIYANNLMLRDAQGRVIVNAEGLPQPQSGNGNLEQYILEHPIGNIQPKLLASLTPSVRYRNVSLTAMLDSKFGGKIVSVSEGMATMVGTSQRTADRGHLTEINGVTDYYMVVPGVKADGSVNDIPVSAQKYYSTIGLYKSQQGYAEEFVHDASYIKLKELSLSYTTPSSWLRNTPFTNLRCSLVARNLCFLYKKAPGNPEGGYDTSMFSQALDFLAVPYSRTYGFTVNLEF